MGALRSVKLLDTTLRDGEQTPGLHFSADQKVRLAMLLEDAGVDIIDAGFPASSEEEHAAVAAVAKAVSMAECAALSRLIPRDLELAGSAINGAAKSRIILFASASPLTWKVMGGIVDLETAVFEAVRRAINYAASVQVSISDVWRSDPEVIRRLASVGAQAGASTVLLADTVGCAVPQEIASIVSSVRGDLPDTVDLGIHCHNDLGLATANTLAAVLAGANHCEVTIAGIGERAGNAALEEVVAALVTKPAIYDVRISFQPHAIQELYLTLSEITAHQAQANKAIIGANAFRHSSGIHQRGVLADPQSFEWLSAADFGREGAELLLGKLSGSAGIRAVIKKHMGNRETTISNELVNRVKGFLVKHGKISKRELERKIALPTERDLS